MNLIPAIDLINGQCVRLLQGDFNAKTVYSSDPLNTAIGFENMGFKYLHMVDLDGARQKTPVHFETLLKVAKGTTLKVDYSGGIRSIEQARIVFSNGAYAITIGSMAVTDPDTALAVLKEFGPEKIILGADVKNETIVTGGWLEQSTTDLYSFLEYWIGKGIKKVMITDVSKDGMMQGPATLLYEKVLQKFNGINLIASGGISVMEDIYDLDAIGCWGAITGKALYENTLDATKLQTYLKRG